MEQIQEINNLDEQKQLDNKQENKPNKKLESIKRYLTYSNKREGKEKKKKQIPKKFILISNVFLITILVITIVLALSAGTYWYYKVAYDVAFVFYPKQAWRVAISHLYTPLVFQAIMFGISMCCTLIICINKTINDKTSLWVLGGLGFSLLILVIGLFLVQMCFFDGMIVGAAIQQINFRNNCFSLPYDMLFNPQSKQYTYNEDLWHKSAFYGLFAGIVIGYLSLLVALISIIFIKNDEVIIWGWFFFFVFIVLEFACGLLIYKHFGTGANFDSPWYFFGSQANILNYNLFSINITFIVATIWAALWLLAAFVFVLILLGICCLISMFPGGYVVIDGAVYLVTFGRF